MDRSTWFEPKWRWLKRFSLVALAGAALMVLGPAADLVPLIVLGALSLLPLLFWLVFIPVIHWKDRYVGHKSAAWGAFLALETSGWSKLFYWFRHVLPDWQRTGRYRDAI